MHKWGVSLAIVVLLGTAGAPAQATSDRGRAFKVPYAEGRYGVAKTTVQTTVKAADGQWRAEPGFPQIGGPRARLALGPAGTLGVTKPSGSTS